MRAFAIATVALVLAAGCARIASHGAGAGLHPWTHPDTVRIGFYEEPDSLDPVVSQMAFSSDVFQLEYDGLIRYDDRGQAIPDLAVAVPSTANGGISRDGRVVTYHLMPGARWHDGVPVTAADVIFTWHAIMNPANNVPYRTGYDRITGIDAPDPHTVRVHFREPYAPGVFLFRGLSVGAIVPAHILAREPTLNRVAFNARPVGSGPYIFRSWSRGGEMRFDANPAYFRGVPKIPHVVVRFVPDQNTMIAQLRAHEVDLYFEAPAAQIDQLRSIDGVAISTVSSLHYEHLTFNTRRPPLDDRTVRRALCYGFDERALYAKVYRGLGRMGPTEFNPDSGWGDPSLPPYPYDPARAAALLETAGWRLGSDGIRRKNGVQLAFSISTVAGVKNREAIEVFLQSAWRALGADVTVKNYPAATLFAPAGAGGMILTGKTDVALFTFERQNPDPDSENTLSPRSIPPAGQNMAFYRNDEVGALLDAGLTTFDAARRHAIYARIARTLYDDVPEYTLDWLPEITVANVDLQGVRPAPIGSDLWNVAEWSFGVTGP